MRPVVLLKVWTEIFTPGTIRYTLVTNECPMPRDFSYHITESHAEEYTSVLARLWRNQHAVV